MQTEIAYTHGQNGLNNPLTIAAMIAQQLLLQILRKQLLFHSLPLRLTGLICRY